MLKFVVVVVAVAVRSSISDEYNLRCWLIQDRIPFLSNKKNGDGDELNKNDEYVRQMFYYVESRKGMPLTKKYLQKL